MCAHSPQLRRWGHVCHLNTTVNHLRRVSPWGATFPPLYTITGLCAAKYQRKRRTVLPWWDLQDVKEFMHGVAGGNGEESHDRSPVNESEVGGPLLNAGLMTTNLPGILSLLAGPVLSLHKSRDWGLIQATVTCFPRTFFCGLSFSPVSCPISQSTHISLFPMPLHHRSGQERADQKQCTKTNDSVLPATVKRWSIQGERFSSEMLELRKGPDFGRFYFEISTQTYWLNIPI